MVSLFLIENDLDFAVCLTRIFEAEGFDVRWSETIEKAIPDIEESSPVAAVVDLHDGTSQELSHLSRLTDLEDKFPILVTAHYQTPDIACKALGIGAT
ncbi:MAG TPA: hypothetical protein ENN67_01070, partial [Firmicutes bacterium]|nr:hypothetical protein [Bacillota bacterium]